MEGLSIGQRRALAVLLLLAVVALGVRGVAMPIAGAWLENRDTIAQMEDSIARYARLSAQVDDLRQTVAALDESDALDALVLPQASAPLAAAALQERVKAVVTASGGALTSTQVLPAETERGFRRVTVNVRMTGSIEALQEVLHTLESGAPYLVTDDVVILARGARKRRRAADPTDLLDVRFNLSGYMRDAGAPA